MTYHDLQRKLHDQPFRPFKIMLINGTTYEVTEPWMVTIGESSAVIVTQVRRDEKGYNVAMDWRTVSWPSSAIWTTRRWQSENGRREAKRPSLISSKILDFGSVVAHSVPQGCANQGWL